MEQIKKIKRRIIKRLKRKIINRIIKLNPVDIIIKVGNKRHILLYVEQLKEGVYFHIIWNCDFVTCDAFDFTLERLTQIYENALASKKE